MCGICGIAGPVADITLVRKMCDALKHRGPDSDDVYGAENIALGHTRLSIIDLTTGSQPMVNENQSIWVVFNGEIYNFRELRRILERQGHHFKSLSDTEVLLHAYEEYGLDFISRLDGIFAFALWDQSRRRLILARDHFGVKPLHYHVNGSTLYFSSEMKGLLCCPDIERKPNLQAVHDFLNFRYVPGVNTLFAGIHRLPAAHYLVHENGRCSVRRYYELSAQDLGACSEDDLVEGLRYHLGNAVRKQLVSDVPLGVYLSGGLDSSSIAAYASCYSTQPLNTFSLGFNEPNDELADAAIVADFFGTNHHSMTIDLEPMRYLPQVIWAAEEPKVNTIQGYLLAKFARRHVKTVLGGLGGDELFGGYNVYKFFSASKWLHQILPKQKGIASKVSNLLFELQGKLLPISCDQYRRGLQLLLSCGDVEHFYAILRNAWDMDPQMRMQVYGESMFAGSMGSATRNLTPFFTQGRKDLLNMVMDVELQSKMVDDFLLNEDRTSMAHGLEVRVPFLDKDLVHFARGIPSCFKVQRVTGKYIFRRAMEGILPQQTLDKPKWGFTFDSHQQFQKDLHHVAKHVLTSQRVRERGWFNPDYLQEIMEHPPHPRLRWHYFFLWMAVGLEIWCQMFIDPPVVGGAKDIEEYFG